MLPTEAVTATAVASIITIVNVVDVVIMQHRHPVVVRHSISLNRRRRVKDRISVYLKRTVYRALHSKSTAEISVALSNR